MLTLEETSLKHIEANYNKNISKVLKKVMARLYKEAKTGVRSYCFGLSPSYKYTELVGLEMLTGNFQARQEFENDLRAMDATIKRIVWFTCGEIVQVYW